jgi:hypothetical protein
MLKKIVRPDSKGRITLGQWAEGISSFSITKDKNDRLILEPYSEIPSREKWLFDNKKALESVKKGIKDASEGKVSKMGDFTKYINEDKN